MTAAENTTESTSAPTDAVIEKLQALLDKYQAIYPQAYISNLFLIDIKREEILGKACENCKGYPCVKDSGKGFRHIICENGGELEIRYVPCQYAIAQKRQARAKRQFKLAKIPAMYVGKTFADYKVDANNKNAVAWAKRLENLYLFGSPGTGKTFLASIMAQEFLKQGKSVIFGDVPTLLDQLKGTFNNDSDSTLEELMKTLSEVDVLILDDLGTETPTEWAIERLYLIINNRYNAQKPLIVTSNYSPDAASRRLNKPKGAPEGVTGSRIISRISQMCRLVSINGGDRRI